MPLASLRWIVALLAAGPLPLWALAHFMRFDPTHLYLVTPSVLAGLAAPAVAYHVYRRMWERRPRNETGSREAFIRATVVALAITEAAALICCLVFLITRNQLTYLGLLMHLILTGAVWPTQPRLESFLETEP